MKTILSPLIISRAVELYATTPNIHHKDVATELGINTKTLMKLRKNADFWAKVYDYYMVSYEGEIVDVVRAMIKEAKAGNVQAGRLVLEHSGKLQKNLNITISSPFEKWLSEKKIGELEPSKEVPNLKSIMKGELISDEELTDSQLPKTAVEISLQKVEEDFQEIDKELIKKKKWLERRKKLNSWNKRAEAVGIAPLPAKRPTKGQRMDWEMSIIQAEDEQSNTNAES